MTAPQKLEKIGRYKVLEKVGKGGMGVLDRGFDPVLDREVAIKLMLTDFSDDTDQMRPRFYREARAAAKLNHRNIVTIFEFAEENNIPYIVMEFLRGTPLGARMNAQPSLTLDDKLNVVAQLCDGLSYAHEQGVVHRDVKPDNVFLLEDGSIKLLDFGIAKLTSSTLTRQGDVLGSASYMSPEQVSGSEAVDGRADVFSAGVLLYELLSGRKPFEGDSPTSVIIKILKEEPTPIETVTTALPPALVEIVMHALMKDPAERFESAEAMARELHSLRKSLHPSMSTAQTQMDETRFASTQVMKALHEDFHKSRVGGATVAPRTSTTKTIPAEPSTTTVVAAPTSSLVPALVGGVVVLAVMVAAIGAFVGLRLTGQPAPVATDALAMPVDGSQPLVDGSQAALPPLDAAGTDPALDPSAVPLADIAPPPGTDLAAGATPGAAAAMPQGPAAAAPASALPTPAAPAPTHVAEAPGNAARTFPEPAETAPAAGAVPAGAAAAETGSLFIDFLNTYSEGAIEVEVDGRKRWSERLGISQQVGGLAKLKLSRVSEQVGSQLKVPEGDHKITVTVLNGDGEVRDFGTTSVHVYAGRSMTLRIRTTRFKNQLQLESVPGEPVVK